MEQILIVDDDAGVRRFLRDVLRTADYHVHEAIDGCTAIELLEIHPVSLLVTDIVMPGKEGIETIHDVKRLFPGIKIVAISGHDYYLELAAKMRADWILEKPFDAERLLAAVRALLKSRRSELPTVSPRDPHESRPGRCRGSAGGSLRAVDAWRDEI